MKYRSKSKTGGIHSLWLLALLSLVIAFVLVVLLLWQPTNPQSPTAGDSVFMYCAAGIRVPVNEIAEQYAKLPLSQMIQLQYGGSHTLLNQLEVAGVGDLYLSADDSYMKLAIEKGLVKETIPVASVRPVVAVLKGNPQEVQTANDLVRADVRVALGNPDAAAVGKKTRQVMEASGHWEELSKHAVVFTPTVNDIANAVKVGSVDAGIVWDTTVAQYPDLEAVRLPELDSGTSQIVIGVLSSSKQPTMALRFARYLTSKDQGLEVFRKYGYATVEGDIWEPRPQLTLYSGGVNRVAIEQMLEKFERREDVDINVVYNGCGVLCAQMKALRGGDRHGAFPDAYFACDVSFMDQVSDLFLDPINVSETDMVIITDPENEHGVQRLQDLSAPGIKLGIANPDESALGALTRRLLRELGIEEELHVNVSTQTPTADMLVNQVKLGGLDAAIVYRANTSRVTEDVTVIDIDHPLARAVQPYAAARHTDHHQTITRLIAAVRRARSGFEAAGFRYLNDAQTHDRR